MQPKPQNMKQKQYYKMVHIKKINKIKKIKILLYVFSDCSFLLANFLYVSIDLFYRLALSLKIIKFIF